MVVAIDGPAGVGKSTVSRAVAQALGVAYLDTGAYYRMATLIAIGDGVAADDASGILRALGRVRVDFVEGRLLLDGRDVSARLRGADVTDAVSVVAALPDVREAVVSLQREWVSRHDGAAVVEGRDIGTVVFPDAAVKVFLTADADERARRRAQDQESAAASVEVLIDRLATRDAADSSRETSPLRPADDAISIDTTHLAVAEVVKRILDLVGRV